FCKTCPSRSTTWMALSRHPFKERINRSPFGDVITASGMFPTSADFPAGFKRSPVGRRGASSALTVEENKVAAMAINIQNVFKLPSWLTVTMGFESFLSKGVGRDTILTQGASPGN